MDRKVVVTGVGVISPVGIGNHEFWDTLRRGVSGIDRVRSFDPSPFESQVVGEVKSFQPEQFITRKEARRMDRFSQFAVCASLLGIEDAGIDLDTIDRDMAGVILGSGIGGITTFEEQHKVLLEKGHQKISPFFIPMMIVNMGAANVALHLNLRGPNNCVSTACEASTHALGEAFRIIQRGEADLMVAVGSEASITPLALGGFCAMKALSTRNSEPAKSSRPFDAGRDGFVMAEGAAALILEDRDSAVQRGARIYAELSGYASTCDAYHITAPDPEGRGASRAMDLALRDAGLRHKEVDYINAHGTSTPLNDKMETLAIKRSFGEHAYHVIVSATKSMTGHLLGAAGALEAAATVFAIYHGVIPPTINLEEPDPECDLNYAPNRAVEKPVKNALSNSFGFGGHNGTLVFSSVEA